VKLPSVDLGGPLREMLLGEVLGAVVEVAALNRSQVDFLISVGQCQGHGHGQAGERTLDTHGDWFLPTSSGGYVVPAAEIHSQAFGSILLRLPCSLIIRAALAERPAVVPHYPARGHFLDIGQSHHATGYVMACTIADVHNTPRGKLGKLWRAASQQPRRLAVTPDFNIGVEILGDGQGCGLAAANMAVLSSLLGRGVEFAERLFTQM
jgi:hypothetical protein